MSIEELRFVGILFATLVWHGYNCSLHRDTRDKIDELKAALKGEPQGETKS